MNKSIVLFVLLPVIWLVGCAGYVPPLEQDPNAVTLILTTGDKVEGRILDIQGDLIRFESDNWVENPHFGEFIRADQVRFVQLPNGSRFTVTEFIDYRWKPQPPAPLLWSGITRAAHKEATEVTAANIQEAEARPESAFEQEKTIQPVLANSTAATTDSGLAAPPPFSLTPRFGPKISKDEEVIEEVATFLVEAELAGPFIQAVQKKKEQGELISLSQLRLVNAVTEMPAWRQRQDDLRNFSAAAEQAMAHVYLYAPDSLSQPLGLRFDPNADMDFRNLMAQLHQHFGSTVTMGDFRRLVAIFEEDGARALREILNHYTDWCFAIENKHPLYSKDFGR